MAIFGHFHQLCINFIGNKRNSVTENVQFSDQIEALVSFESDDNMREIFYLLKYNCQQI